MQRPTALRRLVAGAADRPVAAAGFVAGSIAVLLAAAFARSPLPPALVRDPRAAAELVARMRAGERDRWIVQYDFTRTLADGRTLHAAMEQGRAGSVSVLVSGNSLTFERAGRHYDCTLVDGESQCLRAPGGPVLPASEVLRIAVARGAYAVVRRPDATIAGRAARCYLVTATGHGYLPGLGLETETCLTARGVAVRQVVAHAAGDVEERVALGVDDDPSLADVLGVARSFDPGRRLPDG